MCQEYFTSRNNLCRPQLDYYCNCRTNTFDVGFIGIFSNPINPGKDVIGPEYDHWHCLSVTDWLTDSLTHSRLVNLIDVTLACEDANSMLVEVVTVADVDDVDRVGNSLFQIWKLEFKSLVQTLSTRFGTFLV